MNIKQFVKERYLKQNFKNFNKFWKEYEKIQNFAPNGNVFEDGEGISDEAHFIMRMCTQYHLTRAFDDDRYKEYVKQISLDKRFSNLRYHIETNRICYVYLIDSKGKFYIGSRITDRKPEDDIKEYMSSSKYRDIFLNDDSINFIILKTFNNYRDTLISESYIHKLFNVKDNTLFWNESNQTPWGFEGTNRTETISITRDGVYKEYPSIASTGVYLDAYLLSPFTKQIDKGIRYMYKEEYEKVKDFWEYDDYIYDVSKDSSRNMPIVRISKNGKMIEKFDSITSAINKTGLSSIGAALQRIDCFFVGDSMWLYEDEYNDIDDIKAFVKYYKLLKYIDKKKYTNIKQILDDKIINIYDTVQDAIEDTGIHQIYSVINKKRKTAGGFKWRADVITDEFKEDIKTRHLIEVDVKKAFINMFGSLEDYYTSKKIYENTKPFAPNGNIFDSGNNWNDKVHFIMRWTVGNYIKKAFEAMKIDLSDDNVIQNLSAGNIGTAQRIAKVWCGFDTHDDMELGGGRWNPKPRLASFPNTGNSNIPITKRVDIISNCSHHFIPFHTLARPDSYAIISYIPDKKVLGISKLQRVANWVSQRFWLQEDLTKTLYEEISEVAETDSVYVGLYNVVHGCESLRGARSNDGAFTSEYYGGAFEDPELRKQIKG